VQHMSSNGEIDFINKPREVDLRRTFTFRNSKQTYTGIPIIAANMDTTGTFEMAKVLSKCCSAT
uniref:IMP dehydrogenase/GMP reductase domain-containing protein n=1 Tax=Poecilia reticulata TaxID=8081 RepID=A0A3P9ND79_POERE